MTEAQTEFKPKTKNLPAEYKAQALAGERSLFFNVAKFEHAQRVAKVFAGSTMLPDQFIGNAGNVLIALNYADRIKADPYMVMQSMYVVRGKPGIEGKLVASLINQSGKYAEPLRYEFGKNGEASAFDPNNKDDDYGCRAVTVDKKSGNPVSGPKITWAIVKAEGWLGKKDSKWQTIPEIMFMYRAASWFANVQCPEVKLGMQTVEELRDVEYVDLHPTGSGSYAPEETTSELSDKILKPGKPSTTEQVELTGLSESRLATKDTEYSPTNEVVEGDAEPAPVTPPVGATSDSTEPPAEMQKAEAPEIWSRPNWAKLRKSGFSTFVFGHLIEINQDATAEIKKEMTEKWNRLYDEPCPILIGTADVLPPEQQTGQDQLDATIEAEKKAGIGIDHPPDDAPDSWKEPVHKNTGGLSDMADPVPTPDSPVPDHMNTPSDDMEARERRNMQAVIIDSYEANDIINAQLKLGFTAGITNLSALTLDALVALRDELMVA